MIDDPRILVDRIVDAIGAEDSIVHVESMPARRSRHSEIDSRLDRRIVDLLAKTGIERLYAHQAEAISNLLDGKNAMISTGTNSGKSLCYALPIAQACLSEPSCRALLLYPTKALAQDQIAKWRQWSPDQNLFAATYDGDTPKNQRSSIRKLAHVVATNPDMLHVGILPGHENWARFFKSLRFIVLDEAHAYRGVFGSHVAWIMRRLLRLCDAYGSKPQIVACSATVGNPSEHFDSLVGRSAAVIDKDASSCGRRTFFFVNPPLNDDGTVASRNAVVASLLARLAADGKRTMAFSRSRVGVELVLKYARDYLNSNLEIDDKAIDSYRAGYTPAERREIERRLFAGDLLGLSATNAMELGVDIGGLDAVILNGFPGTVASFWQQAGRAGRGSSDAGIVYVADDDPLDQYLAASPETILSASAERVSVYPNNPNIAAAQIKCMAHEKPIAPNELLSFGEDAMAIAESMDASGELQFRNGRFYFPSVEAPASNVDIRGSGGTQIELRVNGQTIGAMEFWRALQYAHEGAIYLHRGQTYRVQTLDLHQGFAELVADEPNYYTQSIVQSVVESISTRKELDRPPIDAELAWLKITTSVVGYRVRSIDGNTVLAIHELELPVHEMETEGIRWNLPAGREDDDPEAWVGSIHGAEHALLATAPIFAGCDRGDIGSNWYAAAPDSLDPAVFVYDGFPGGIGLSASIWRRIEEHWQAARRLLESCPCVAGCPRCLFSARCEVSNADLDKAATIRLLIGE